MAINLHLPGKLETLRPTITVIGVGGAGCNAVNNMISSNLEGVNFVVANTDAQALDNALTERRIQLGSSLTRGLGAGAKPEIGRASAEEALDEVAAAIEGSNMVFITAGMGGGTGTGAAPVIARFAKERGILTVGVVTKPFQFEGNHRMRLAESGLQDMQQFVDTLIVIPNQNLFRIANERTTFADAFRMADEVLHSGVRGVTDLMIMPGLINLDFADIRTVMSEMGKAMMGTGEAEGPKRAVEAAEAAISNPLLDDVSMKGAKGVLINITGSYDMTLFEADEAASRIREEVDPNANIIFGATFNQALEGKMRVSVVATGIDMGVASQPNPAQKMPDTASRIYGINTTATPRPNETRFPFGGSPAFAQQQRPAESVSEPARRVQPVIESRSAPLYKPVQVHQHSATNAQPLNQAVAEKKTSLVFVNRFKTTIGSVISEEVEEQQVSLSAAVGMREKAFISPAASQPVQRSFFSENDASTLNATPSLPFAEDKAETIGSAIKFLHKMANVGRALATTKPERNERALQASEKPRIEVVTERKNSSTESQEDYLDIPAFLRRQAN